VCVCVCVPVTYHRPLPVAAMCAQLLVVIYTCLNDDEIPSFNVR